jgi:hypothetical protein
LIFFHSKSIKYYFDILPIFLVINRLLKMVSGGLGITTCKVKVNGEVRTFYGRWSNKNNGDVFTLLVPYNCMRHCEHEEECECKPDNFDVMETDLIMGNLVVYGWSSKRIDECYIPTHEEDEIDSYLYVTEPMNHTNEIPTQIMLDIFHSDTFTIGNGITYEVLTEMWEKFEKSKSEQENFEGMPELVESSDG